MAKTALAPEARPLTPGGSGEPARQAMAKRARRDGLADFQALAGRHQSAIFRVACRLTGNRDDAEDLTQESLIEAFRAFDRFQTGTRFDLWICRIMMHTYIDTFKRRRRLEAVSFEEVTRNGDAAALADPTADPREIFEKAMWSEPVQAALNRLAPEFRAVVVLCDADGLSYEEASRVLRCPVGTVRSRLHRARDQLRAWLLPPGEKGNGP